MVMTDADPLAEVKARIAREHLGDPRAGERLRGGNIAQLREDAERLRADAGVPDDGVPDDGSRPSLVAALHVLREDRRRWAERLFGR